MTLSLFVITPLDAARYPASGSDGNHAVVRHRRSSSYAGAEACATAFAAAQAPATTKTAEKTAIPASAAEAGSTKPTAAHTEDEGTLVAARIAGARALLGPDANGKEDGDLLASANALHLRSQQYPDDADAQLASQLLWYEEAVAWARNNSAPAGLSEETKLRAYLEMWSLAVDPPPQPVFKDHDEIGREYIRDIVRTGETISFLEYPTETPITAQRLVNHFKHHPDAIRRYYKQFSEYIDTQLDRFSVFSAVIAAQHAGLNRLHLEIIPKRLWHISYVRTWRDMGNRVPTKVAASLSTRADSLGGAYIFELPGGQFGYIDAYGAIGRLPRRAFDQSGLPTVAAALRAYGTDPAVLANASRDKLSYEVGRHVAEPASLRELLVSKRHTAIRAAIDDWKKQNYKPTVMESVMKAIVPFYETYHNVQHDPGYELTTGDIAWDSLGLAITLGGIVLLAGGGYTGLKAAMSAVRAVSHSGARAMARVGAQAVAQHFSLKVLVVGGARELVDFVIPVFSATDIVRAATRSRTATKRALIAAMARTDTAFRSLDNGVLLERIYAHLVETGVAGRKATVDSLRDTFQKAAAQPVPSRLYRGQTYAPGEIHLYAAASPDMSDDDILLECIRHSASTGGSGGKVLSLTSERSVALRFARGRDAPRIFTIDTTTDASDFRSIENILVNDGARLVQQGKMQAGTLRAAILHALHQEEKEFFYIRGSIPDRLISSMQPLTTADT